MFRHRENINWGRIPEHMRGGIIRYIDHGIEPGHFLTAVICNDLKGAVARGDDENQQILPDYVKLFYNYAPGECWGSKANMEGWIKLKNSPASTPALNDTDA
jgi:hypothetical protein